MLISFTLIELIIIALVIAIGIILVSIPPKGETGHRSIIMFGYCLISSAVLYLAIIRDLVKPSFLLISLLYLILLELPTSVLFFSLEHLDSKKHSPTHGLALITLLPILLQFIFISRATRGFLFIDEPSKNFEIISATDLFGWLSLVYFVGILTAALVVIAYSIDFQLILRQNRAILIIWIAGVVSVLISMTNWSNLVPIAEPVLILLSFSIIGIAFTYYRAVFNVDRISQVYDNAILNDLRDGIIVLNRSDYVIEMNSAAEQITGLRKQEAYKKHIESIFPDWHRNNLDRASSDEMEFRGSVYIHPKWKYLSIRIMPMEKGDLKNNKILLLRDITNIKITDNARQYAREAMFVFLHSLFISYKDSPTIQEFLERALYQVLYTFSVESGFIYLIDTAKSEQIKYSLVARHGSLVDIQPVLAEIFPPDLPLSDTNRETLLIPDVKTDERISKYFKEIPGDLSITISPLSVEQEILGILVLGRMQVNGFDSYDVIRHGTVADEIASFIFKERTEKQQIAFIERQRLVRDLHDSITQKLYGLVTITEAVQVGLDAGVVEKAVNLMPRVSETARQALREMRLFLHELDPIDLEREGLMSALHQRLAAVEGRSDIKARLVSQENFSFSKEKELAIYYIAEEALNNTLKHAQAQTVLVKLRRRGHRIYLDIIDDGCGYEPTEVQPGGRGMKNMKERASQIGATFKIASGNKNKKGTRVSLSFLE
jgi:PAS domain S-box-containing protein